MVHPDALIQGNCYFHVVYADSNLFVPLISTYIFQEKKQDDEGEYWLFQDPCSYFSDDDAGCENFAVKEDMLHSMIELSKLRAVLKGLEDLHPLVKDKRNIEEYPVELTTANIDKLKDHIQVILENNVFQFLTITIKYRDAGFTISRKEDGLELGFRVLYKEHPGEEDLIRTLFAENSLTPHTDYLAQHGRYRILAYPFPADAEKILGISKRLLADIYNIKSNETLEYYLHEKQV